MITRKVHSVQRR